MSSIDRKNLHIVLGPERMDRYTERCDEIGMSKSAVGRVLVDGFINGDIKITPQEATVEVVGR